MLARCNHKAAGDALLLEHDPVAPVVDRDAGEWPRQGGADDATDDRAGWTRRRRDVCASDEADNRQRQEHSIRTNQWPMSQT